MMKDETNEMVIDDTIKSYTIVPAILEYLNRLEEGETYDISSIWLLHNAHFSEEDALNYLKIIESRDFNDPFYKEEKFDELDKRDLKHIITNCSPDIKLINNHSFKIVYSKVFRLLTPLHRVFTYIDAIHRLSAERQSYKIPNHLQTKEFKEKIGRYFLKVEDDSYYLSNLGKDAKEGLDDTIADISRGQDIDEAFNKLYGGIGEGVTPSKQPQASMVGKIDGNEKKDND